MVDKDSIWRVEYRSQASELRYDFKLRVDIARGHSQTSVIDIVGVIARYKIKNLGTV